MNQDQILRRPIITEKSLAQAGEGKYTFEVDPKAQKREIAKVIETVFGVHVVSLKKINLKGKERKFGPQRKKITTPPITKAIAKLAPEEKIDVFTAGVEEPKKGV